MSALTLPPPSGDLAKKIVGVWWLLSREDWTKDGVRKIDLTLGADPFGILSFTATHFAAQFMKRDRSNCANNQTVIAGKNNTAAVGGYDAYFGTYKLDERAGQSEHTLIGSINPSNVGIKVVRDLRVDDSDQLIIQLPTTGAEGEPLTRTLVWKRIG